MIKNNKKVSLGIASALLVSSVVPAAYVVKAEDDVTKVYVNENALQSAKVSNVENTLIEASSIFNLKVDKSYKYTFKVTDGNDNIVTDALSVTSEGTNIIIKHVKDGNYKLEITVSEIPEVEGTITAETSHTIDIESITSDFKISNILNQTVVVGNKEFVVSNANDGILTSKEPIDLGEFSASGKSLEEYVGSKFNFNSNVKNILSLQKYISKDNTREFSNVKLLDSNGNIQLRVKPDTELVESGGNYYFKETSNTVSSEPTLRYNGVYSLKSSVDSIDLTSIITNERGDEFDYMLVGNDFSNVNASLNGSKLILEAVNSGNQVIYIKVLKNDGTFVTFSLNVTSSFTGSGVPANSGIEEVKFVTTNSNKVLKELNSNIDSYTNVILYRSNSNILLRDNLIDFENASINNGHFILGSYDNNGNLVDVYDLKYSKEDTGPVVEVPVWKNTVSDKEVEVSKDITVDLASLHNSKDVVYEIINAKSNISSYKISEDGKLVIKGLADGEDEYSIKMKNSAGESEVLKFKVKVKVSNENTVPVWNGTVTNKEVSISKDITVDLKSLHNSQNVVYEVSTDKQNLSSYRISEDGKLTITGLVEGNVEYSIKMKNSVGYSETLKFTVKVVNGNVVPVWTGSISNKDVNVSKDIIIDLKSYHNSQNVVYEITTNKSNITSHKVLSDDKLVITGLLEGEVEYTIKMKNSAGESGIQKFVVKVTNGILVSEKTLNVGKSVIKTFNLSDVVERKYTDSSAYTYRLVNGGNQFTLNQGTLTVDNRDGISIKPSIEVYEGTKKVYTYNINVVTNNNEFGLINNSDSITLNSIGEINTLDLSKYVKGLTSSSVVTVSNINSNSKLNVVVRGTKLELTSTGYGNEVVKFKVKDGNMETKEFILNVKIEQKVNNVDIVGNEPLFKSINSIFTLQSGENITKLVVNYKDSSIVNLELADGLLKFTPKKDGNTELEVIAITNKGTEYTTTLKVKVDYDESKDKEESNKPLDFKITSSQSKNVLDIDFTGYSTGEKLKEDFELKISNGKAYVGGSIIDVSVPSINKSTYVFMKVNGELISVPFHRNSNGDLIIGIKYEGQLVFNEEASSFGNLYGHYAEKFIEELSNKKILESNWTSNDKFEINKDIKGNEFTNVLTRAMGYSTNDSKSILVGNNIISSSQFEKLNSSDKISREEAVSVLYSILRFKNSNLTVTNGSTFVDFDKVSDSNKQSVSTLQSLGIINGKPGLVFDPTGNLTRAQVSKIVYLGLNHMK